MDIINKIGLAIEEEAWGISHDRMRRGLVPVKERHERFGKAAYLAALDGLLEKAVEERDKFAKTMIDDEVHNGRYSHMCWHVKKLREQRDKAIGK